MSIQSVSYTHLDVYKRQGLDVRVVQLLPPCIVKLMHQGRVALEAIRGSNVLNAVLVPQAITGTEGLDARFSGNPRAGGNDNVGVMGHGALPELLNG